ncbi:hypothetical protein [Dehalococcoides mccartyi]|uniref:hypothetical protein n=1 Tax=Dehalococcoides mccartyi TaxID=61435 RepID=UPI00107E84C6|nr:hypothetical protein [Dehalococcoides mccartyi]QBX64080.1 hypothetical protein DhcFL2_04795 [Dehalococcoides mccartyi]
MSLIDIGIAAINRAGSLTHSLTILEASKPANDTGILDVIEVWFSLSASGVKVGTFYGSGTSYTGRDYETIGSVASGAKRTFTGLSIDVTTGDLIGVYYSGGRLEIDTSGGSSLMYSSGDAFGSTKTYSSGSFPISLYGTGATSAATISPSAIAPTLAFGTAKLNQNIVPSGISAGLIFGTVNLNLNILPSGIASTLGIGAPIISFGGFSIAPSGIASTLVFGIAKLNQNILPSGIASGITFGKPELSIIVSGVIRPSGIPSGVVFGTPILSAAGLHIPPQSRYVVELHNPITQGWRIPSSHNDSSSAWEGETKAYDGSIATGQAYTLTTNAKLELIPASPLYTSKIRIYGGGNNNGTLYFPNIVIDVYYSGAWHNVYTGGIQYDAWVEKSLASPQTIEKARVSCTDTLSASYPIKNFYVTEFWFYAAPTGGELLSILENAHAISIEQSLNKAPVISFSLPADDDKSALLTRANEIWIRDIANNTVLVSGILDERVDTR